MLTDGDTRNRHMTVMLLLRFTRTGIGASMQRSPYWEFTLGLRGIAKPELVGELRQAKSVRARACVGKLQV